MTPRFVFRHPRREEGHIFITTEDPTYRYEVLCGHCGFPIEQEDDECPRCQRALEDCPVCRHRTHRRSPIVRDRERPQLVYCPVCHVTRHPIGWTALATLDGSFCTNLYGCPAGGLVLRSDELATLPRSATLCPVCRHPDLLPLSVKGFQYLVRRCLFCSTLFAIGSVWSRGWSDAPIATTPTEWPGRGEEPCRLCGRNDRISEVHTDAGHRLIISESVSEGAIDDDSTDGIPVDAYLHLAELARSLALETDSDWAAFRRVLDLWFDPSVHGAAKESGLTVRDLVDTLVRGTLHPGIRHLLQGRLERFEEAWQRHLGVGLGYRVAQARESRSEKG